MKNICDFYNCEKPICEIDLKLHPPTLRFCQQHSDEMNKYIQNHEIGKMLGFWVKSRGGADKMVNAEQEEAIE
jgi:hypothetical protein